MRSGLKPPDDNVVLISPNHIVDPFVSRTMWWRPFQDALDSEFESLWSRRSAANVFVNLIVEKDSSEFLRMTDRQRFVGEARCHSRSFCAA
jgi:hypothetical protein